jgi:membrane protein implicated in regulation of membrane protease activity
LGSFIEACINTAIGFFISLVLTALVLPAYGHAVTFSQNLQITAIFTIASIARSYLLRRWFNARIHRAAERMAGAAFEAHQ